MTRASALFCKVIFLFFCWLGIFFRCKTWLNYRRAICISKERLILWISNRRRHVRCHSDASCLWFQFVNREPPFCPACVISMDVRRMLVVQFVCFAVPLSLQCIVYLNYSIYDKLIFSLLYFHAPEEIKDLFFFLKSFIMQNLYSEFSGLFLFYFTEKHQ